MRTQECCSLIASDVPQSLDNLWIEPTDALMSKAVIVTFMQYFTFSATYKYESVKKSDLLAVPKKC